MHTNNCSFKGYIPVKYYAKNPATNEYVPVTKKENIRKCHGYIVRNLNGTIKNNKNKEFVDEFKSLDVDYRNIPLVTSVYDNKSPVVYLMTGKDVDAVKTLAKPVGIAKREAYERTGKAKSFEAASEANNYFRKIKSYINNYCRRIKDKNGKPLTLNVFFNPEYTRTNTLKGFKYESSQFISEEI